MAYERPGSLSTAIAFAIHAGVEAIGHRVIAEGILPRGCWLMSRFAWMPLQRRPPVIK